MCRPSVLTARSVLSSQVGGHHRAGDSYIAGFLHARLTGADIPQARHAAAASAAQTCTHLGAWPQQPAPVALIRAASRVCP
jgi:fructose-1-phosphate kinase PfkB-like protein